MFIPAWCAPENVVWTSELETQLWNYLCAKYDAVIVDKADGHFMEMAAWFLDTAGILKKREFLERYATTIGRKIYLPFKQGEISVCSSISLAVHEITHVVQFNTYDVEFLYKYLFDPMARALYEAEAMKPELEIFVWANRCPVPNAFCDRLAGNLHNYNCNQAQIETVAIILKSAAAVVNQGGLLGGVGTKAVHFLNGILQHN